MSIATVSRVLNGYADVSDETRRRVLALAEEIDYTPSAAARTLVTKRSHVIGVVLFTGTAHPDLQHPFFQEVLVGLKHTLGAGGYDLLLFATEDAGNGSGERSYLRRARHHRVDGMVLMGVDPQDPEVRKVVRSPIPCVAVDIDLVGKRAGYVMSDNEAGAREAVRHLHGLGHERIAIIGGPLWTKPAVDRLLGYRAALEELGLPHRDDYVREGDFYAESGQAAMEALLGLAEPPTAVFAASDLMAVGAIAAVEEAGLRVPDNLGVVGFDDILLAGLVRPGLTTIRQDKVGLGTAAGEAVLRMVARPDVAPPIVKLPVELVIRESCGGRARGRAAAPQARGGGAQES